VKFHNFTWSINHTVSNWKWGRWKFVWVYSAKEVAAACSKCIANTDSKYRIYPASSQRERGAPTTRQRPSRKSHSVATASTRCLHAVQTPSRGVVFGHVHNNCVIFARQFQNSYASVSLNRCIPMGHLLCYGLYKSTNNKFLTGCRGARVSRKYFWC